MINKISFIIVVTHLNFLNSFPDTLVVKYGCESSGLTSLAIITFSSLTYLFLELIRISKWSF